MARLFTRASSEYLEIDVGVVTAYPFTMACGFNSDDVTNNQNLMTLADKDATNQYHRLVAQGSNDKIRAYTRASSEANATSGGPTWTANRWFHACGVWASATSRAAYLDGGNKGTNATDLTPAGIDRTSIGRVGDGSPGGYMSGLIAEAAIWNVALTDAEVAIVGAPGVSPLSVRPANIVGYWRLVGRGSEEIDIVGRNNLTVFGPVAADHPRIIHPHRRQVFVTPAAVAAGGELLQIPHHLRGGFNNLHGGHAA